MRRKIVLIFFLMIFFLMIFVFWIFNFKIANIEVVNSYNSVYAESSEIFLCVSLNQLWNVRSDESIKDEILKRYLENSFCNVKFTKSDSLEDIDLFVVDVFLNRREKQKGRVLFEFTYSGEDLLDYRRRH